MSSVNVLLLVNKHKTKKNEIIISTQVCVLCLSSQYHIHVSIYINMLEHHHTSDPTSACGLHILVFQKLFKLAEINLVTEK